MSGVRTMDSAVIAAIVSVLGAGFLAMLFFFMRGIRTDIAQLRTEMQALRAEMQAQNQALRAEIGALRAEMQAEIQALRAEMHAEFAAVRSELNAIRVDIAGVQQSVSRHEGILSEHARQLSAAAS